MIAERLLNDLIPGAEITISERWTRGPLYPKTLLFGGAYVVHWYPCPRVEWTNSGRRYLMFVEPVMRRRGGEDQEDWRATVDETARKIMAFRASVTVSGSP